jgi:hypothetical protein
MERPGFSYEAGFSSSCLIVMMTGQFALPRLFYQWGIPSKHLLTGHLLNS